MEWDKDAAALFTGLLVADSHREGAKIHAETLARRAGHTRVTREDMAKAKKTLYGRTPEVIRLREFKSRAGDQEAALRQRMEQEAAEILGRPSDLITVLACRAEPADRNFEPLPIKAAIESKLREIGVTEILTDKLTLRRPVSNHHHFVVAISACVNGCNHPETKTFGLAGVVKPSISDKKCSECYLCVDGCKRNALILRRGRPEIDSAACDLCGHCVKVCPEQVFTAGQAGFRVFVGGQLGRFHQPGFVLFKMTDQETMLKALEATVGLIKDEAEGEEKVSSIIQRLGVAPLYRRIYQGT